MTNIIAQDKMFKLGQITFKLEVRIDWNYELQATVSSEIYSYEGGETLHGSWLNNYIYGHSQTNKSLPLTYCSEIKFSFYKKNLIQILEFIDLAFEEN